MKKTVSGKNLDNKEVTVHVKSPNAKQLELAQLEYGKAFGQAVKNGCLLKREAGNVLRERGLWGDTQQKKLEELSGRIRENLEKLKSGKMKLWGEARPLALSISDDRREQMRLLQELNQLESTTAEGIATDCKMNYYCSACTYDDEGNRIYSNTEDFQDRLQKGEDITSKVYDEMTKIIYDFDPDYEKDLDENKFLKANKMIDDNYRYLNKDGKLTDRTGRLLNENGDYINEAGEIVDENGKPIKPEEKTDWDKLEFIPD